MAKRIIFNREQLEKIKNSQEFRDFQETSGDINVTLDTYLANEKNYAVWAEKFSITAAEARLEEAFGKMAAEYEYAPNDAIADFLTERDVILDSVSPRQAEKISQKINEMFELDTVPYGGDAVAVQKDMRSLYTQKSAARAEDRAEGKLEAAFGELAADFEYGKNQQEKEVATQKFLDIRDAVMASLPADAAEKLQHKLISLLQQDAVPYGGDVIAVSDELRTFYDRLSQERAAAQTREANAQTTLNAHRREEETDDFSRRLAEALNGNTQTAVRGDENDLESTGVRGNEETAVRAFRGNEDENNSMQKNDAEPVYTDATEHNRVSGEDRKDLRARIRSKTSDQNKELFDREVAGILHEMHVLDDAEYNTATGSPQEAAAAAEKADELSDRQKREFDLRFAERIASLQELLEITPPSLLAKSYNTLKQFLETAKKQNPNADVSKFEQHLDVLAERMDSLAAQMESKTALFFADRTNIADTYDGYNKMFTARAADLDANKAEDKTKLDIIAANRKILDELIGTYDEFWNLQDVKADSDENLDRRFEQASKLLEETVLEPETYRAAANFRFLDQNGQPVPQFIDPKDGSAHLDYAEGYQVDPKGKLATVIKLAENDVLLKTIGGKDDITKDKLQQEINDTLPFKLFEMYNSEELINGIAEHPEKFTKPDDFNTFKNNLYNFNKPLQISDAGYEAAIDYQVNAVDGFAHRLVQKTGNRSLKVVPKLYDRIATIDKFAAHRTKQQTSKRQARIKQLKQAAVKFGISGISAAGITVLSTISTTTTSIPAAAIGVAAGIGITAYNIYRKKKTAKKAGQKYGWKEFKKDKALHAAITTTTLGAASAIFAVSGNPVVATACAYGALAVGTTAGVVTSYNAARKDGLGKAESLFWGTVNGIATLGGAAAGRAVAHSFIDSYNVAHPENEVFQKKTVQTETSSYEEIVYKPGVVENAQNILENNWYRDHPELLQQRIDSIEAFNAEHGTNINPYRYLLAAHDAGALAPDNNLLHVQGGPDVYTNGNHTVLTESWAQQHNVDFSDVKGLAGSIDGGTVNVNPDAFQAIDGHINASNQVGAISEHPFQNDGVLDMNATTDEHGTYSTPNGTEYTTYADHGGAHDVIGHEVETQTVSYTPNEGVTAIFGWAHPKSWGKALKDRLGSLMDKISGQDKMAADKNDKMTENALKTDAVPVKKELNVSEKERSEALARGLLDDDKALEQFREKEALVKEQNFVNKAYLNNKQIKELKEQFPNRDFRSAQNYGSLTEEEQTHLETLGLDPKSQLKKIQQHKEELQNKKKERDGRAKDGLAPKIFGGRLADDIAEDKIANAVPNLEENTPQAYLKAEKKAKEDDKRHEADIAEFKETGTVRRIAMLKKNTVEK